MNEHDEGAGPRGVVPPSAGDPEATQLYVVAVAAVILRDARVLAMRRAARKRAGPGLWETLSGRVEAGEEPAEAAAREIVEECGLEVELDPRPVTAYRALRLGRPMIVIVYRARYRAGSVTLSEEHDDFAWLTPEEFGRTSDLGPLVRAVEAANATPFEAEGRASGGP